MGEKVRQDVLREDRQFLILFEERDQIKEMRIPVGQIKSSRLSRQNFSTGKLVI